MKIAFFSNFLNHHQLLLCQEFVMHKEVEFVFVATKELPEVRLKMGYEDMNHYPFVLRAYEGSDAQHLAEIIAREYDVVIWGDAPKSYIEHRLESNKITFRFCERILKKGTWRRFIPTTRKKINDSYIKYNNNELYILGASSYVSYDFELCGFNTNKCFKWGYFPEIQSKNLEELFDSKSRNIIPEILYAGRLLHLKHVIDTVKAVHNLKTQNIAVHFTIIGEGECQDKIQRYIKKHKLENEISMIPFLSPLEVRKYMDKADIFVFGSNFYEGWGAVVNEAMNSACAMVVSHAVGSATYLIDNGENGYIYKFANISELTEKIKTLVLDKELRQRFGTKAYQTISLEWTAEIAVKRFLLLCQKLQKGENCLNVFTKGPCSHASITK